MQQISFWGMMNPRKTQFIILLSQIMVAFLAFYVGILLFVQDILLPNAVFYTGLTLFFIGLACYPIRRARYPFWKKTFAKQKTMDAILLVSYVLTAVTIFNRDAHIAWKSSDNIPQSKQIVLKAESKAPVKSLSFKEKWMKKHAQFVIKQKLSHSSSDTGTVFGIIGIVLLMILGTYLTLFLACSASCSGSSAGAVVILVGGMALIITLGVLGIRKLLGKRKDNYQPMPETPVPN